KSPSNGNAPELTCDECIGNDQGTGDQPKFYDPFVSHRIPVCADKQDGKEEMCERKPIVTIRQERILTIGIHQRQIDLVNPGSQSRISRKAPGQKCQLSLQRNSCQPAQEKTHHEEDYPSPCFS